MILNYGKGAVSTSLENTCYISHEKNESYDYLVIVDSRGLVSDSSEESSYLYLLKQRFDCLGLSYIIVSRPKYLTIFPTLVNFLQSNQHIKFKNLITHIGFVDCTPKKSENMNDIILQMNQVKAYKYTIQKYDNYVLSSGEKVMLESIEYSEMYLGIIVNILDKYFQNCYLINTPCVDKKSLLQRARPKSFFKQLCRTNELINNIVSQNKKNCLIDISNILESYDGVHYTNKGHSLIFNKITKSIKL